MDRQGIDQIERDLNIQLPEIYKSTLLNNPLAKPGFDIVNSMLLDDPKQIIEINQNLRVNGFQGKVWPENFMIIGVGRALLGYYFINIKANNEKIYLADNEKKFNPKSIARLTMKDNFVEFIQLAEMLQSVNN